MGWRLQPFYKSKGKVDVKIDVGIISAYDAKYE